VIYGKIAMFEKIYISWCDYANIMRSLSERKATLQYVADYGLMMQCVIIPSRIPIGESSPLWKGEAI